MSGCTIPEVINRYTFYYAAFHYTFVSLVMFLDWLFQHYNTSPRFWVMKSKWVWKKLSFSDILLLIFSISLVILPCQLLDTWLNVSSSKSDITYHQTRTKFGIENSALPYTKWTRWKVLELTLFKWGNI